jgi:hypothetical protein
MSDTEQPGTTASPGATTSAPVLPPELPADAARPAYAAPVQQPFFDRVLGMRAVIAVALAALIIGGLSGFILGEHTNGGGDQRFGPGGFRGAPQGGFPPQGQQQFPGQPMR